jgi:hypothetical protein
LASMSCSITERRVYLETQNLNTTGSNMPLPPSTHCLRACLPTVLTPYAADLFSLVMLCRVDRNRSRNYYRNRCGDRFNESVNKYAESSHVHDVLHWFGIKAGSPIFLPSTGRLFAVPAVIELALRRLYWTS